MLAKEVSILLDLILRPFSVVLHDSLEIAEIGWMFAPSSLIFFLSMYANKHIHLFI